ncbi:hypothetical protein BDV09DRAFT_23551 [Aspergillus tetrazonus]
MIVACDRPPVEHLRPPNPPTRDVGAASMEIVTTEEKSRIFPQYSGPPPPMHRIPPADAPHGLPGAPGLYDQPWRPYPPYENHHAEPRRVSNNAPQPPLSTHPNYPPMHSRELPQLPSDGPFSRPASLPVPAAHAPPEPPQPQHANFHPMNGAMNGAPPEASPVSAPDYARTRMSFPPQEQIAHSNGDPPPPPQSLPPNQYPTTVPPPMAHTPAPNYDPNYNFQNRNRKPTRAQQACDQCRTRKAKCDEGRPACSHCKENNYVCVYKEVPPHKQDKSTQLLLDRIQQLDDQLNVRLEAAERLHLGHDKTLDQMFKVVEWIREQVPRVWSQYPVIKADGFDAPQKPETKELVTTEVAKPNEFDPFTKSLIQTGEDGELSIPVEHTTAAHKLLTWPTIKELLHGYDENYVMRLEQSRGLVRFEGRGETQGMDDGLGYEVPSQQTSLSTSFDDNFSQYTTPTGAPWSTAPKYNEAPPEVRGIDEFGVMSIDADTVRRYVKSYLEHIHRLHPFLNPVDLERRIDEFIAMHCPTSSMSAHGLSARNPIDASNRGAKRKRSGETLQAMGYDGRSPTSGNSDGIPPRRVEKTMRNAIILLVLALGRICEVRDEPIRGPCIDHVIDYRTEQIPGAPRRGPRPGPRTPAGTDALPLNQGSFHSPYDDRLAPTPTATDERFITLPDPPHLKNVDTVPGFVYYAYAAGILAASQGATSLPYAQAALLAGLYIGQLAHPFQSHSWIAQAARACQNLTLAMNYGSLEGDEKDLVCFAYWTCLQLESDILAELDLPASGISRSESRIDLPLGSMLKLSNTISEPDTMMMFFYSTQIHLRKVLNRVHTDLYKVIKKGENKWNGTTQEILSMNLELWRSSLPPEMRWNDNDPPSPDINHARMRAKYWGARYIIHRPVLFHALHFLGPNASGSAVDSPAGLAGSHTSPSLAHGQRATDMTRISSDLGTLQGSNGAHSYRDLPPKIRRACGLCVQSAIQSTIAFDGVKGRPVVTNIFGTAHAQFGNMLVLSTTYLSHLQELVDRNDLERLLRRTIAFLLRNRNISPTLRVDAKILTDIYEKIFEAPPILTDVNLPH